MSSEVTQTNKDQAGVSQTTVEVSKNPVAAEEVADNKYGKLSKDIVDMLVELERTCFREDKPVDFCGLKVYPIQVRDFEVFSSCTECLTLNKNEDKEGVRMSNLEYLLSRTQLPDAGRVWSYKLQRLCELVFRITNGVKCKKCGKVVPYDSSEFNEYVKAFGEYVLKSKELLAQNVARKQQVSGVQEEPQGELSTETHAEGSSPNGQEIIQEDIAPPVLKCPDPDCGGTEFLEMVKFGRDPKTKSFSLYVDGHQISAKDFNKLRQIILYQNFYDYADDSWVDPEVKRDHDERVRMEQEKNDLHASIEKKVVCLSISTHYTCEEIYDMSVRRFTLALATVDDLINYKIMKQSVMSGFVSLPKGKNIEHWIYKPNKDMYGDTYKSTEQMQSDVSNL